MPYTPTVTATTESQAVAAILSAGGEPTITTTVGVRPDQTVAQTLLRDALKELLQEGWSFNTEHGFEVLPVGTMPWTSNWDSTHTAIDLNVFVPPANLLSFEVTKAPFQQGSLYLDTAVRPSRTYNGGGTLVFYDRMLNRDGFERDALFIEPVWLFDFDVCPQAAKDVARLRATRRYLADIIGDSSQDQRISGDEAQAYRMLKRSFGDTDDLNVYNNAFFNGFRAGRRPVISGVTDGRYSPGPVGG